jgi:hypothetical protein
MADAVGASIGELLKSKGILWKSASTFQKTTRYLLDEARLSVGNISSLLCECYGWSLRRFNLRGKYIATLWYAATSRPGCIRPPNQIPFCLLTCTDKKT